MLGQLTTIPRQSVTETRLLVTLPAEVLTGGKTVMKFGLFSGGELVEKSQLRILVHRYEITIYPLHYTFSYSFKIGSR